MPSEWDKTGVDKRDSASASFEEEPLAGRACSKDFASEGGQRPPKPRISRLQKANDTVFAFVAYNPIFENATIGVIALNAIWLGIDVQYNHDLLKDDSGKLPLEPWSFIVENVFCVYFTFEVLVRFVAFKYRVDALFDAWFVFDSILVIMMVVETWILTIIAAASGGGNSGGALSNFSVFRLLRLLRLARMARLMRAVPELLTLVKGMLKAAKAVSWIMLFLAMTLYVFGIMFTTMFIDTPKTRPDGYVDSISHAALSSLSPDLLALAPLLQQPAKTFPDCAEEEDLLGGDMMKSLGDSMMNLFTRGVLGDNLQETCDAILAESVVAQWLFFIFFALTFALLLNMLIGVLCEVVSGAAMQEQQQMSVNFLKHTIKDAFLDLDANRDGLVCQEEWVAIKDKPQVRKSMVEIGMEEREIDVQMQLMQEVIFQCETDEECQLTAEALEERARSPSIKTRLSQTRDGRLGVTVEELMETVVEVRPGQDASALDFEMLRADFNSNLKAFENKLCRIENCVRASLGPDYVDEDDSSEFAGSKWYSAGQANSESFAPPAEAGADLQAVPLEVLFNELEQRTALE